MIVESINDHTVEWQYRRNHRRLKSQGNQISRNISRNQFIILLNKYIFRDVFPAHTDPLQMRRSCAIFSIKAFSLPASYSASVAFLSRVSDSVIAGSVVAPYPSHFPGATPRCLYHSLSRIPPSEMKPRSNATSFLLTA